MEATENIGKYTVVIGRRIKKKGEKSVQQSKLLDIKQSISL